MKCPECSYNVKGKYVTYGTKCPSPSCNYTYVFSKTDKPDMTDGRFHAMLRKASGNGTRWFTFDELWATYSRMAYDKVPGPIMMSILVGIFGGMFLVLPVIGFATEGTPWAFLLLIPIAILFIWLIRLPRKRFKPPTREAFQAHITKWENAGRKIENYIREPMLHQPPPNWTEADIYDYGVERILIVERDILVDWFVLNGWHTQNRTLVFAESGYPHYITERAQAMLQAQPDLPVLLLHDSTESGGQMEQRILHYGNPVNVTGHPITDLGIHTDDVASLKRLKYLAPHKSGHVLPADALGFKTLAPGLATAAVGGIALSALIAESQARGATATHVGTSTGDFG